MNPLQTITLASVTPQPWRNGGGTTQELLAWPQREHWVLRLSVARIDRAGPFSAFPGVRRSFCVLQGAGVRLRWDHGEKSIKPGDAPLDFDGADAPDCDLLNGPTTDLNWMVRGEAGRGGLQRVEPAQGWRSAAPWRGVYVAEAAVLQRNRQASLTLPAHSLSWSPQASQETWVMQDAVPAWWLEFCPHGDGGHGAARP